MNGRHGKNKIIGGAELFSEGSLKSLEKKPLTKDKISDMSGI